MKKILFFATMAILFTSCLGDDPGDMTTKMTLKTSNLVIPEKGEPFVLADVQYKFEFEHNHNTAVMSISDMPIGTNAKLSFESDPVRFSTGNYTQGTIYRFEIEHANTMINGMYSKDYQIEDLDCMLTTAYYTPSDMLQSPLTTYVIMDYEIGDLYEVKTFPTSAYYSGETKTYYKAGDGTEKVFSSNSALYGINMNLVENTAEVVIYDAQFAEEMPIKLTMKLKGLKIEYTREGYIIKGENIVPLVGDDAIEYPRFAFDEFVLECNDDYLTKAQINFMVAGQYKAEFFGSYIIQ